MKNGKRRSWTTADVRTLKTLARKKTAAGKMRLVWAYRLMLGYSA
jgi:hypothetical protein